MFKKMLLGVTLVGLAACSNFQTPQAVTNIENFKIEDFQNASKLAKAVPNDKLAASRAMCYDEVVAELQAKQAMQGGVTGAAGVAVAFEKAAEKASRVAAVGQGNDPLVIACGPLVLSAETTLARLQAVLAGGALGL